MPQLCEGNVKMGKTVISDTACDLIYISHCALNGKKPDMKRLKTRQPMELYALAEQHAMNSLISFALEGAVIDEAMATWKKYREQTLRRNLLLDAEARHLCKVMDEKGIWHMRLKGSIMKNLYPRMEMRQMSDQDILFDTTRREEMREYMLARGYDPKGHHDTHHDIYHKPPLYNIELHHTLFELHCDMRLVDYYRNVKEERMIPDGDGTCGFHFNDEDFYIYMIAHAYKHYTDHGVGLRSLVDVYVYDNKKPNLDWDYVNRECAKLGMDEYEQTCRSVARKLFRDDAMDTLTDGELELLHYCVASGTHGNEESFIRHELRGVGASGDKVTFVHKLRYLWKRTFPSAKWMRENDRMARKHPKLLVIAWIARIFRGFSKRHTAREFKRVMDTEEV